jgi:hypothetical protein
VEYTRGVAFAATGQPAKAREALDRLETFNIERAAGTDTPAKQILPIAIHALQGEIALRGGDPDGAVTHFEAARDCGIIRSASRWAGRSSKPVGRPMPRPRIERI